VLLVGHEPTWSALVSLLIGGGSIRLPTAGVAGIRFEADSWRDIEPGSGELRFLVAPKVLGE
jgi:phosphohistidine phosphatase